MIMSRSELQRYSRQLGVEGWNQEKLSRAKVLVVGVGGLGGIASAYLAAAGIGEIRICDYDKLELSNLNRQILYSTEQIGRPKIELAQKRLSEINPEIKVVAIDGRLNESNFEEYSSGCDLIIDGLDNHADRLLLNKAAFKAGIPYIYAAVNAWQGLVSVFSPPKTPCLACIMPDKKAIDLPPQIFGAIPGVAGSLEAIEAIKYLVGTGEPLANKLLVFNGLNQEFSLITIEKNPRCPVCSGKH
jgi:molybdopterin-synthase adenylyltransferase